MLVVVGCSCVDPSAAVVYSRLSFVVCCCVLLYVVFAVPCLALGVCRYWLVMSVGCTRLLNGFAVCCLMAVCYLLLVVRCVSSVGASWWLASFVSCCLLSVVCRLFFADCHLLLLVR